jgi:tetratricopeptide (TPR) repeat protein
MTWKEVLRQLEYKQDWDTAIEYMQRIIEENPDGMDAYIYMNYLLMNLLVEEDYDQSKHDYYAKLAKYYFDLSYSKYSENAEYLFYTALTAVMSEWYWGMEVKDYDRMFEKAIQLAPDNLVYRRDSIISLNHKDPANYKELKEYYELVLDENSDLNKTLRSKGAVGAYLLGMLTSRAKSFLA